MPMENIQQERPILNLPSDVIMEAARLDPVWWIETILGDKPWSLQKEIIESVRDNHRTNVTACHDIGKSWLAARVALWFLYSNPYSIVISTAPTFRQVEKIIWQEINHAHSGSTTPLGGKLLDVQLKLDDKWFAFGFSTDNANAFQGLHAISGKILVIFDEASGIVEAIWDGSDGVLSSEDARFLGIGNPTDPDSMFKKESESKDTKQFKVCVFDSPNFTAFGITIEDIRNNTWAEKITGDLPAPYLVTPFWVYDKWKKWCGADVTGEDNPLWQAKVMGQFPTQGADDSVFTLAMIEAAQRREIKPGLPRLLSVDVARFGNDSTCIYYRQGDVIRKHTKFGQKDTMQTVGACIKAFHETKVNSIIVDGVGVGGGVVDRLREQKFPVTEVNAGSKLVKPKDKKKFFNAKALWFWHLRERMLEGNLDLDADDDLSAQLVSIKYKLHSDGTIRMEDKKDHKKRTGTSPDDADAVVMAFSGINSAIERMKNLVK